MTIQLKTSIKTHNGNLINYQILHSSSLNLLSANFNLYIPSYKHHQHQSSHLKFPIIYYLAGLTCNQDTGPQKSGLLLHASIHRIAIVFPDTSPRGANIQAEDDHWDFGTGAGFYLNASHPKWKTHYQMETFIIDELPEVLKSLALPLDFDRQSIMGHSMGGHGAVTMYLNHLDKFKSCSGFAPILNPTRCPWGIKAFTGPNGNDGYLLNGIEEGKKYDATELISKINLAKHQELNILIDYGNEDKFYKDGQLLPKNFLDAMHSNQTLNSTVSERVKVEVREQDGYDHSYYFVSSFVEDHIKFHARFLCSS